MFIINSLLLIIFSYLGFMHFYWAFGGTYGLKKAIPTRNKNEEGSIPGKPITIFVGLILLFFGSIYFFKTGIISSLFSLPFIKICSYIIPSLFFIRVIGDFRYVGLFKKIKETVFAKADSQIYIPLCTFICLLGIISIIYN